MRGFLHQFASRSLGLAPQIKSRAALPYAAPAADFSMTEAASKEIPPAIERPGFEPQPDVRRHGQTTGKALPAPIVAENPARATPAERPTSPQSTSQPPRLFAQQLPDHAPLETTLNGQPLPPAIIASPVTAEPKFISRHPEPAPDTRRPAEETQPALPDLESLITRLLGDNKNPPEKSPEAAAPATMVTARQASQRPAEISTIRPQSTRERQNPAPEPDSAPEVHITIGRLEVNPPSRPTPTTQPPRPARPGAAVAVRLPGPPQRRPPMSNALAIAGVTAVIKDLLDSGMIDQAISDTLGAGVLVTSMAPDTVSLDNADPPQLNLFLHQVTPNVAWRNAALPSRDAAGNRITNPPLALDLHYLLTAYGRAELQAEVLLGYALQLLHETPVLPRDAIRRALAPTVLDGAILPTVYKSLRGADLAEQIELLKITPAALGSEEMSRLWSAIQARYRPTAAFQVSVVLIESRKASRSPLPVLSRGETDPVSKRDRGVLAFSGLTPPLPTLEAVVPADRQPVAVPGGEVTLEGLHLDGVDRQVTFSLAAFQISRSVPVTNGGPDKLSFTVPNDLPVGLYRVELSVQRLDDSHTRRTNQLPLALAPQPVLPPFSASRNAGMVTLVLDVAPPVRPGQVAALILGEREIAAEPITVTASQLTFKIADAPPAGSTHLARLRVDGFDSPIIDRMATPVAYLDRRITLP